MNSDLVAYYRDRAKEYEKIYSKPERQQDLIKAGIILQHLFAGKDLLEIACGTGYWTMKIAESACSIHATDINNEVIEIGKQKEYPNKNVVFSAQDLYSANKNQKYEALFGGFIWSHIPVEELPVFIETVHKKVNPGNLIVFMDNLYVEGSNLPVTETDTNGNTYQTRKLGDGSVHRVLKNFPTQEFLVSVIGEKGTAFSFVRLDFFWILSYKTV